MGMYKPYRDRDYTPWSLFWPVTAAVVAGILIADLVRLIAGAMLAGALFSAWSNDLNDKLSTTPGHLPARPNLVEPAATYTPSPRAATRAPIYPGPSTAIREGEVRACVGGYIAYREADGWSQHTNGGLRPCRSRGP